MDRCRRPKIPGRSEVSAAMIFHPGGDGERCLERDVGRGEGRPHDTVIPLRAPMVRGDGRVFLLLVGSGPRNVNC